MFRAMRFTLVVTVLMLVFAGVAEATSSEQPAWVDNEATSLTAGCGAMRAEVIARMDFARKIHIDYYLRTKADPTGNLAKVAGDAQWHAYWTDTYVQAIKLLKQDCH